MLLRRSRVVGEPRRLIERRGLSASTKVSIGGGRRDRSARSLLGGRLRSVSGGRKPLETRSRADPPGPRFAAVTGIFDSLPASQASGGSPPSWAPASPPRPLAGERRALGRTLPDRSGMETGRDRRGGRSRVLLPGAPSSLISTALQRLLMASLRGSPHFESGPPIANKGESNRAQPLLRRRLVSGLALIPCRVLDVRRMAARSWISSSTRGVHGRWRGGSSGGGTAWSGLWVTEHRRLLGAGPAGRHSRICRGWTSGSTPTRPPSRVGMPSSITIGTAKRFTSSMDVSPTRPSADHATRTASRPRHGGGVDSTWFVFPQYYSSCTS